MSVERRGGDKYFPTVQRRGEKSAATYRPDHEPRTQPIKPKQETGAQPMRPYFSQLKHVDVTVFESRVARKVAELEANPVLKKVYLDKFKTRSTLFIFGCIVLFSFPALAGVVLSFAIFYAFVFSLMPKDKKAKRMERFLSGLEMFMVASKLKKSS